MSVLWLWFWLSLWIIVLTYCTSLWCAHAVCHYWSRTEYEKRAACLQQCSQLTEHHITMIFHLLIHLFYPFYHLTWADIGYQTGKERNWWNILISFPYLPWFSSWHPSVGIKKWNIRYIKKYIYYAEEEKTDLATLVFVCTKLSATLTRPNHLT